MREHFDVVVVGAGLSGIGAGYHLQARAPGRSYVILESRERLGGTWDLFRYPGIRSDSDMFTLGFAFRPWTDSKAIADGPSILRYLDDAARDHGIDRHIRYRHSVKRADWSSADARWIVTVDRDGEDVEISCAFLYMCAGYYRYDRGYTPDFPGADRFQGRIVHPQFWTDDIDYAGRNVVVIGSGATAVTLVPEMAKRAAHVVMLQRSPTYIVSRPSEDALANRFRRLLPSRMAYTLTRIKNVLLQQYFYRVARKHPEKAKGAIVEMARKQLGAGYDVGTHFTPTYNPWDQRLCLVPDSDLFASIREGKSEVVTDSIETFTETGIRLASGRELAADLIVTATGLQVQLVGGVQLVVDGVPVEPSKCFIYKGMMFSGVPNMAFCFGYTNASWTLKADLTSAYVARLLNAMQRRGLRQVTPEPAAPVEPIPFVDFTSGYIQRVLGQLPQQGARKPWRLNQNYAKDMMALRFGRIDDELVFSNPEPRKRRAA